MIFDEMNDLDLTEWRHIRDELGITTNALWFKGHDAYNIHKIPDRPSLPKPDPEFHGVFIAEIPYQMILRYTKKGETVWDCFGGSGVTYDVARYLDRECIINDIEPGKEFIQQGDSRVFDPGKPIQLAILHPPYYNIIRFSEDDWDLSNCKTLEEFLGHFRCVVRNVSKYLENDRMLILVCGNIYMNGEEQTLGVWCKDLIRKEGYTLKSHIVKDYGWTKGSTTNFNLAYYRALRGGYNNFYGDNIFVLQKRKSRNTI